MKKILVIFASITLMLVPSFALSSAAAVDIFSNCGNNSANGTPDVCPEVQGQKGNTDANSNPIIKIIKAAINILSIVVGIAAVIGVIVSGLRMITSGGDANATASARTGLTYSLIGIAVTALAQSIVVFVLDKI